MEGGSLETDRNIGEAAAGSDDLFWTRLRQLASAVKKRLQLLGSHSMGTWSSRHVVGSDSMLLFFTYILAHSTVIKIGHIAKQKTAVAVASSSSNSSSTTVEEHLRAAAPFEQEALNAAAEVARLARQIPSLGCFKVHPFLPDLLGYAASYLTSKTSRNASLYGAEQLLRILSDMQGMNSLARDYLHMCIKD